MQLRRVMAFIFLCTGVMLGGAQTLSTELSVMPQQGYELAVRLGNFEVNKLKFGVRVGATLDQDFSWDRLEFGVDGRLNVAFGPIGNVLVQGSAHLDTTLKTDVDLRGNGVLASSVGARARLLLFNTDIGHFVLQDAYQLEARPNIVSGEGLVVGVGLGVTYRVNRNLVLELDPNLLITPHGIGGFGDMAVQWRRVVDRDDVALRVRGTYDPDSPAYIAFGVEYRLNRRDVPSITGALWYGTGTAGSSVGGTVALSQKIKGTDLSYDIALAAEPYRSDHDPYWARATLNISTGENSELSISALTTATIFEEPHFGVSVRYEHAF